MFYRLHCFSRPLARCAKIISLLLLLSNTHIQPLEAKEGTKQQDYSGNQHIIITLLASLCCIWFYFVMFELLSSIKSIVGRCCATCEAYHLLTGLCMLLKVYFQRMLGRSCYFMTDLRWHTRYMTL